MCVSCSFSPLVVGRWRERLKRETRKRATKTQTFLRVIHDFPFYLYVCCWMNVGLSGLQWGGGNLRKMPRRRRRTTTKQKQKKGETDISSGPTQRSFAYNFLDLLPCEWIEKKSLFFFLFLSFLPLTCSFFFLGRLFQSWRCDRATTKRKDNSQFE